ncbi:MAG: hypothetical protein N3G22_03865 [Candidatus Micrarchaeota archaeon]|nr:hypothetical protein [Candidatus Micrarchaeota archaeon]
MEVWKRGMLVAAFLVAVLAASLFAAPFFSGNGAELEKRHKMGEDKLGLKIEEKKEKPPLKIGEWKERLANMGERMKGIGIKVQKQVRDREAQKGNFASVQAEHLSCRLDATISIIEDTISAVPQTSASLSPVLEKLAEDRLKLESLSAGNNTTVLKEFISGTLRKDMAEAVRLLAQERSRFRNYNVSKEIQQQLKDSHQVSLQAMKGCEKEARANLGIARLSHYNAIIQSWQKSTDKLGEKGISTAGMQSVIDGAKANVIRPIENAIASNNTTTIMEALKIYCLGDGCNGTAQSPPQNYHGFAKINLERLQAILNAASTNSTNSTNSSLLSQAQAKLNTARTTLEQVGTSQYSNAQGDLIWGSLKDAAKLLREYLRQNNMLKSAVGITGPSPRAEQSQ